MIGAWLSAVDAHPETIDTDLAVAAALVLSDAWSADDIEDVHPDDAQASVEELESLGFLRAVIDAGAEVIYEVSLP
ncbi:hypothetical protein [Rhodococcus opacus]|uniref:hypothetical protein n=1 Tax=Rhodococcus opacus TaxID=37919 RepID=UPI00294A6AFA|nr:hypothetical protein [Rhodococcus opacus]MDV6246887.1 hypothetical protein [Rhodococcus opacus]